MAEKTLNTRIILKNDELQAWVSANPVLKKGEIALVAVSVSEKATSGTASPQGEYSVPTYMMKVGDGVTAFNSLHWVAAAAADVYAWAKKPTLDYNDLPETLRNEIDTLQSAVGTGGAVASAIAAAIGALDAPDTAVEHQFVTAVAQEDGTISVSRAAIAVADVTGLQTALDNINTELGKKALASDVTSLTTTVNGHTTQIAAVNTTLTNYDTRITTAQSTADGAVSALNTYKSSNDKAVNDLTTRVGDAEDAIEAIEADYLKGADKTELSGQIAALTTTVTNNKSAADTGIQEAKTAAANALTNAKSYTDAEVKKVNDTIGTVESGKTVVQMIADAKTAATYDDTEVRGLIAAEVTRAEGKEAELQTAINTEKGRLDNFLAAAEVGEAAVDTLKEIQNYINTDGAAAEQMTKDIAANKTAIEKEVSDRETAVSGEASARSAAISALKTELETAIGKKADQTAHDTLATRVTTAEGKITTLEGSVSTNTNNIATNTSNISKNTTAINDLDAAYKAADSALQTKIGNLVKEITYDTGLKQVSRTDGADGDTVKIGIDDSVTFIFNCGTATTLVD